MIARDEHQQAIAKLCQHPLGKRCWEWLEAHSMPPAFGNDGDGRVVMHGLTAAETLEYLRLYIAVYEDATPPADRERFNVLRLAHEAGMKEVFAEHRRHKLSGCPQH